MSSLTRREFSALGVATGFSLALPAFAQNSLSSLKLNATTRTIEVNGRAATVMGLMNAQGRLGLTLEPRQRFQVDLTNSLDIETIIHWHGQIPPNAQDGVKNTNPTIKPGETRSYDFAARPGTFWMHSHLPNQEIGLLSAPLIVHSANDLAMDRQEVVMFLHDFSFKSPEEVLSEVIDGKGASHSGSMSMEGMDHGNMSQMNNGEMSDMQMDINDFDFDAYLANDRTLEDPEIIRVERKGRVLLRIINASSMTGFWIDLGILSGKLVAIDGEACQPYQQSQFGFTSGQRLDIEIDLPVEGESFPIMALREGARERTGIILLPPNGSVSRLASLSDDLHPIYANNTNQEIALKALSSLSERPVDCLHTVMLEGLMNPYSWTINGLPWGQHVPIKCTQGERVEIMFHNMSMMAHPIHLHGHVFQVVSVGNKRVNGAKRDTVNVPPMDSITIALDAGEIAPWMLHCHHMGHLETGMMTEFVVEV